jgi:type IV pilus assembly protein PilW
MIKRQSQQAGFSLVELMVAMTIGLFLIAGLVSVFMASTRNYITQQAIVEIQDKGRFGIKKMREDVQRAGFKMDAGDDAVRLVAAAGASVCDNSFEVLEIYSEDSDVDTVRCYYLEEGELKRNTRPVANAFVAANSIVIIDGVVQLGFKFVVDVAGDGPDVTAGEIYQAGADVASWSDVIAVRMELIVASNTQNVVEEVQTIENPFNDAPAVDYTALNLQLHQAYTAVFSIRNRI